MAERVPGDLIPLSQVTRIGPPPSRGKRQRSTVLRWIRTGKIEGWRVLGRWYVSEAELRELLRPEPAGVPLVEGARLRGLAADRKRETGETLRRFGVS
jgi:hypothetical protein